MTEQRLPIKLACTRFLAAEPMNMGECMELLELAQTVEEAKALAGAYSESIEGHVAGDPIAAHERAIKNLKFGFSYMEKEHLLPLYFPTEHNSPDVVDGD